MIETIAVYAIVVAVFLEAFRAAVTGEGLTF